MTIAKFNNYSPVIQHAIQLIVAVFLIGVVWQQTRGRIDAIEKIQVTDSMQIQRIDDKVDGVGSKVQGVDGSINVLRKEMEGGEQRQEDFRREQERRFQEQQRQLDRIFKAVETIKR